MSYRELCNSQPSCALELTSSGDIRAWTGGAMARRMYCCPAGGESVSIITTRPRIHCVPYLLLSFLSCAVALYGRFGPVSSWPGAYLTTLELELGPSRSTVRLFGWVTCPYQIIASLLVASSMSR